MDAKKIRWRRLISLLLLLTFGLRVWALDAVPPGLTHDEASNGHDSAAILRGVHRMYFPVGYGHEPLYDYSVAAMTLLLGQSIFTLRFTTVCWSLATWIFTLCLARRWWGRRAALLTTAGLSVGFWPLMMARVGLRAPTLPALLAASALAYDHAITAQSPRKAWGGYLLAGLCLGAGFYTYMASRGMPLLYLVFLAGLLITDRRLLRRVWPGTLALLGVAAGAGLPLFLYLTAHPELEQRITQLGGALIATQNGDWRPLWNNIRDSLPMIFWRADPRWLYNIGERAMLEPFLGAALGAGVLGALARIKDRRALFTLIWLAGGLAPAFLTTVDYNTLHAIAAMPAIFLLVGFGLDWVYGRLAQISRPLRHATAGMLTAGFLLTSAEVARAYFVTWGQNRDVRVLYHYHVVALGRHLDAVPDKTPVVITSLYPGEFHDPYTMEVTLRREDLTLRWADGRTALFFPREPARLYTETQSAPDAIWQDLITPDITPETTLTFRQQDIPTSLEGYLWNAPASWETLRGTLQQTVQWGAGNAPPHPGLPKNTCPIHYGKVATLAGYRITPATVTPGATVEVLTAWEIDAPAPEELVLFVHILNENGEIVTQIDRLDAPSWQWQAGDRFAHIHRLLLPNDLAPGNYGIAVGFFTRAGVQRLPVTNFENVDRVLLPLNIEVKPQ
ncbi:MAG: glycosyltransferase family 39 protein [Anaerolineae bacterium]|nr:glycosyltransferase family 39 protein [Anaerolineae bacterium]